MPAAVLIWVWFCAWLNVAGWTLSAIHELNAPGYAVALTVWLVVFLIWRKKTSPQILPQIRWSKCRRRFRRPFPLAFLILAALAFLGGALYPPTNYDALAYRLPRILHWLAADQWHWIHTIFVRLNARACGDEWVSAPFLALLKTDRLLFLVNIVSFVLLPGLVFSVFTRLGVRRRVAWHWMWLAPTGYGFLLQAGSIGNDLFGAVFALAAVDFALRAKISGSQRDFFASILAVALLTGSKLSDMALALPWALALLPSLKLARRWPARTFVVCLLAALASILPTIALNLKFSRDWTGGELVQSRRENPVLKAAANVALITGENFVPPVFPAASACNRFLEKNLPPAWRPWLDRVMEHPGNTFHIDEMQVEENAGLGFGLSILLLAGAVAAAFQPRETRAGPLWQTCVRWSPVISLAVIMTQSGLVAIARLLTPYYLLLLPPLLARAGQERLVRRRGWQLAGMAVFGIALVTLAVSPARPLFPVKTILGKFRAVAPQNSQLTRVEAVYSVYGKRWDAFAPARDALPQGLTVLGLVTTDDPEASLWRPFGSRRIEHVCPQDTPADLKQLGVEYILVGDGAFNTSFNISFDEWCRRMNAQVVQTIPLTLRASAGPRDWHLVKLQ
jgi:hypothetical protein